MPYWPAVYKASEVPLIVQKHGPSESYDLAPRANIFRRDQATASNFSMFKKLCVYDAHTHSDVIIVLDSLYFV